ncbi:MAG: energy-coupling factor transporter transmembrane protein EcfT [Clostridia bacterium]|nr:energy-coupling factor transporter transmembrane protein EcfT [Clostridia bacterium]
MLNDVTFGQFYPAQSFVHRLDPRLKLLALIAIIVLLFVADNFYSLFAVALVIIAAIAASRVLFKSVLRSVKGILFILVFTAVLNLFFHTGEILLCEWWIFHIYLESIIFTVFFVLRLFFLVMASSILTLTTTPVSLTDGIESLLKPLKYIKFPVHELALIMSIALRFIPTLIDETNRIISAQKARGADFESGNIFKRIKAIVPILIPLLISAFRRADELGDAMDARCYSGSKNRTKYKKLKFGVRDLVAFLIFAALIAGVVLLNIYCEQIFPEIYQYIKIR